MERKNLIETEILKTKNMIAKIKQLGIDTIQYEDELQEIKNNKIKLDEEKLSVLSMKETNYQELLNNLDELQRILNNESDYFSVLSLVELIELNVNNWESLEKVDKYIDYIEKVLRLIRNWDSSFKMNKDEFIKRFYGIIYQIIKYELVKRNNSKLLDIILSNNNDIVYLDNVIQSELKENPDLVNNKVIKEKVLLLDIEGLEKHYVDEELIRLIAINTNSDVTLSIVKQQLIEYEKEMKENSESVLELKEKMASQEESIKDVQTNANDFKRKVIKRISSLAVTLTLITGINLGHYKLAKDVLPQAKYKTSIENYDSSLDAYQTSSDYLPLEDKNGHVAIKVYETPLRERFLSSAYDGDYTYYYLASEILKDMSLENLITMYLEDKDAFYEYIINHNGIVEVKTDTILKESERVNYSSDTSKVFKLDKITLNLENNGYYIEGEKYYQHDLEDYKKDFEYAYFWLVGIIIFGILVLIEAIRYEEFEHSIIKDLESLSGKNGDIANYRFYKLEKEDLLKAKNGLLNDLKTLLLNNKDLAEKFIAMYEKNSHYLINDSELKVMYEEAIATSKELKKTKNGR